ncbi:MAG: DNA polymerase III subunit beta [bacterium]|nr:DNA polymerase III subunit beta [bacterium]
MEIVIQRDVLHRALQSVQGVVESRSSAMPILQNALISTEGKKNILVQGTNLDIGLRGVFEAEVRKGGSITLNARKLFDIVRELPDAEVHITEQEGQWVRLECARANFRFPGLPSSEFPSIPEADEDKSQSLSSEVFLEMIRKTMFAISTDETRYTYNGVYMETEGKNLRLVATDGHRLALIERECPGVVLKEGVIVHKKALGELVKLLAEVEGDVQIALKGSHVIFRMGDLELSARLIDGQFPNYKQVIPEGNESRIQVDREQLVHALRRVSLLSSETRMVKFVFGEGQLVLTTNGSESGEAQEVLESDYSGKELVIGFNSRYCLEALNILEDSHIFFELKDSLSPGIIIPSELKNYTYVLMPMRV